MGGAELPEQTPPLLRRHAAVQVDAAQQLQQSLLGAELRCVSRSLAGGQRTCRKRATQSPWKHNHHAAEIKVRFSFQWL